MPKSSSASCAPTGSTRTSTSRLAAFVTWRPMPRVRRACAIRLCLPAGVHQLCTRSRLLLPQGEAMMSKHLQSPHPKLWNGHYRGAPVEPLSARIVRLRVARGYSVYELATTAGIFAGTIKRLESGKLADKRVLPALSTALGVPFCLLVCGDHSCGERACVPAHRHTRTGSAATIRVSGPAHPPFHR
jgi:DNA-binding XRE family transcriptional regulator